MMHMRSAGIRIYFYCLCELAAKRSCRLFLHNALWLMIVGALFTTSGVHAEDVSPPSNLRSELYSSTAAELFWDRAESGLLYQVLRNGESVGDTDGVSFFDNSLAAGQHYEYEVIASDSAGNSSSSATTTLTTASDPGGVDPAPATNLRGDVYSSTAAEIFWTRSSTPGVQYEVYVDDILQITVDALSWFTDDLEPGTQYRFSVRARFGDGAQSSKESIELKTNGGITDTQPAAPSGARFIVYSGTVAELFWDRAAASSGIVSYSVSRNDDQFGSTQGTSFIDDQRQPNQQYVYDIVAIDSQGRRSSKTRLNEEEGPGPTEGLITLDSYDPILTNVVSLLNAELLNNQRSELVQLGSEIRNLGFQALGDGAASGMGLTYVSRGPDASLEFSCDAGGRLSVESVTVGDQGGGLTAEFFDCTANTALYDGKISYGASGREGGGFTTFEDFSAKALDSGEALLFDGQRLIQVDRIGFRRRVDWEAALLSTTDPDGEIVRIENFKSKNEKLTGGVFSNPVYQIALADGSLRDVREFIYSANYNASFSVRAPFTNNELLSVDANLTYDGNYWVWVNDPGFPLSDLGAEVVVNLKPGQAPQIPQAITISTAPRDSMAQWDAGEILVTAADGSSLSVIPLPTNADSIRILLNELDSVSRSWADFQVRCQGLEGCR